MKNKRLSMSLMRLKKKLDNLVRGRGHVREHYRLVEANELTPGSMDFLELKARACVYDFHLDFE